MKRLFTLIIVLATACGGEDDPKPTVAPEFLYTTHIETFYSEATKRGLNLTRITPKVYFVTTLDVACDPTRNKTYSNSYKSGNDYIIELNQSIYEKESNGSGMETVIFREMAHLVLGKPYDVDLEYRTVNGTSILVIMYKCASQSADWNQQRIKALDYLFN